MLIRAPLTEERKRLLDIIVTHSPQSRGSFNMLGVRFLGREASGYDRRSSPAPKKQAKIIPENWGPSNR